MKNKKFLIIFAVIVIVLGLPAWDKPIAGTSENVSGFAWSENIGWISFNNISGGGGTNYGVHICVDDNDTNPACQALLPPRTGKLVGYAWSENIGWIRFDPNGPYPTTPNNSASADLIDAGHPISGWARACAGAADSTGCAETFSVTSASGVGIYGNIHSNPMAADSEFLYLAGYDSQPVPANKQWRVEKRSKKNGQLASAFGQAGVIQENPSSGEDIANSIAVDDSFIYIVGSWTSLAGVEWRIEKRDKNTGQLADGFGAGGIIDSRILPKVGTGKATEIAVDASFIYISGSDASKWRLEKYNKTNGMPDNSFGAGGAIVSAFDGSAHSLATDNDYIYSGGYELIAPVPVPRIWRIEKINKSDGTLVWAKESPGSGKPGALGDDPYLLDIIVQGDYIYLAGRSDLNDYDWRVEKRYKANGDLVPAFGADGVVENTRSQGGADYAVALKADSRFLYIVGVQGSTVATKWRMEKRNIGDGSPVNSFGINGVVIIDFTTTNQDWLVDADITDDYLYFFGADLVAPLQWRLEKRDLVTGGLNWAGAAPYPDPNYSSSSVFTSNPKSGGWDGWIKLRSTNYGVWIDTSVAPAEFRNWAWGSDVVGWISFNCKEGGSSGGNICVRSNYKVITGFPFAPVISNLSSSFGDPCAQSRIPTLSWQTDANSPSYDYEIQIDNQSDFSSPEVIDQVIGAPTSPPLTSSSWAPAGCLGCCEVSFEEDINNIFHYNNISFGGGTYWWRVRDRKPGGPWSDWKTDSFVSKNNCYPAVDFTPSPDRPSIDEEVTLVNSSQVWTVGKTYLWDIDVEGTADCVLPPLCLTTQNPIIKFTARGLSGKNTVSLTVTDSSNYSCQDSRTVSTKLPLPDWIEVAPQ